MKINKSNPTSKKLSSKQRKRQIDAKNRAEALKEVLETKVTLSKSKFSIIKERKKDWEDFNKNVVHKSSSGSTKSRKDFSNSTVTDDGPINPFAMLATESDEEENDDNDDDI